MRAIIVGFGNAAYNIDNDGRSIIYSHYLALRKLNINILCAIDPVFTPVEGLDLPVYSNINSVPCQDLNNIDILAICVPTINTYEVLLDSVDLIKPKLVMLEKPVAFSEEEFDLIVNYLNFNKIRFVINYQRNWDKNFDLLTDFLKGEEIERISIFTSTAYYQSASHVFERLFSFFSANLFPEILYSVKDSKNIRVVNNNNDYGGFVLLKLGDVICDINARSSNPNYFYFEIIIKTQDHMYVYDEGNLVLRIYDRVIGNDFHPVGITRLKEVRKIKFQKPEWILGAYNALIDKSYDNLDLIKRAKKVLKTIELSNKFASNSKL